MSDVTIFDQFIINTNGEQDVLCANYQRETVEN